MNRVGRGEDRHRLGEPGSGPLRIGGVDVPHERGLVGHSDADVLLHALADALLGAIGKGDIGEFFPDNDPTLKNMDSRRIITFALDAVREAGYAVGNADVILIGEKPKFTPHKPAIRASLAELLGVTPEQIACKATTTEKMGALGRSEGLGCTVVVSLIAVAVPAPDR